MSKKEENISDVNKKHDKVVKIVKDTIVAVLLIFITFGCFCVKNKLNNNVYQNVYLFDTDISGYTSDKLIEFVKQQNKEISSNRYIEVYQGDELIYKINPADLNFNIDTNEAILTAINFGRDSNFLINNLRILKAYFIPKVLTVEYSYSVENLESTVKVIDAALKNRYVDDSYELDTSNNLLIITRGSARK